ncbi:D-alanyl-D-alanine carboxypeptidase family protein [Caldicellulosiruptor morganii]|uniref:serine-type D-Ala-D-Ala carboxypeptidase n=1 Tax=Caldicellulosiruptor morganii TaxID=1387555 RepID=A0ABY7BLJ1_9FIRM|nr:D-alanyl-D-alanine carboxypeptidase family protein [Caldicellulosiruptor morganii]WAM32921.1 D-alanyl-D-alanine carboxypeptidase [Caldicellulosiruptor morganii]
MTKKLKQLFFGYLKIILLLTFLILNTPVPIYATQENNNLLPDISAKSAILIDAYTGQILYQKNPDLKCFPASTTKLLTALVAISKEKDLNKIFKVSKTAIMIEPGGSSYYLNEGETISFQDALYAMLLISANDAANVIAENVSGSIQEFVKEMNSFAQSIGAKDSHFVNPNGLHNPQHYTTAHDLGLVAREAYKNEILRKIMSTTEYKITTASMHKKPDWQIIYNINKLLRKNSKYYYPYANGMKTGYTAQAKRCLIASAKKDDIDLIAVILASDDAFADAIKLFNYGFNNFKKEELFKQNQIVGKMMVDKTNNKWIEGYIKSSFFILKSQSSNSQKQDITYQVDFLKDIKPPVHKDTVIGNVYIYSSGNLLTSIPVLSYESYIPQPEVSTLINSAKKGFVKGFKFLLYFLIIVVMMTVIFIIATIIRLKRRKVKLRLRSTKTIDFSSFISKKLK